MNNASVHTDASDRLRENMKLFSKNKMLGGSRKSQMSETANKEDNKDKDI